MAEGRLSRNLVLSVCDFRVSVAPLSSSSGSSSNSSSSSKPVSFLESLTGRVGGCLFWGRGTQLLLHGGADKDRCYSDIHAIELERSVYRELLVGGFSKPTGRWGHSVLQKGDSAILFGGMAETHLGGAQQVKPVPPPFLEDLKRWSHQPLPSNELFALQLDDLEWTQPETQGTPPPPRGFHSAAICGECMLIFGGVTDAAFSEARNDLYALDLSTWRWAEARTESQGGASGGPPEGPPEGSPEGPPELEFVLKGPSPSPRYGHGMVSVPNKNRCLMFGGAEDGGALWCLDLSFTKHSSSSSSNSSNSSNSVADLETVSFLQRIEGCWSEIPTQHTGPGSRRFASVSLVSGRRLFVFGGVNITDPRNPTGLYVLNIGVYRWMKPMYEGSLNLRCQSTAGLHDKLILFGGLQTEDTSVRPFNNKQNDSVLGGVLSRRLLFLSVLEIREGGGDSEYRFKLVTVGDSGVGKSCLLMRFVQDCFSESHVVTIGVDFYSISWMVGGRVCTLQLWDTAGQEKFSGLTSNYYRNADGFILVFDATKRHSFDRLPHWVKQIRQHHDMGPSTVLLLLGNKFDLSKELAVSAEEAQHFADSISAHYVQTSAKTSANVDAAFLHVASRLAEKRRAAAAAAAASSSSSSSSTDTPAAADARNRAVSLAAAAANPRSICSGCSGWRLPRSPGLELTDVRNQPPSQALQPPNP